MANDHIVKALTGGYQPSAPQYVQRSKYLADALKALSEDSRQIQSGGELAARLGAAALTRRAETKNQGKLRKAQASDAEAMRNQLLARAVELFPNDPRAQAMFAVDPEAMIGAAAKGYEPQTLSQGQTLIKPGQENYTAPVMGVDGGIGYTQTPDAINWGAQRGPSHAETETGRHNLVDESQGWRGLDIGQQNADTGQFSAQTGRMAHDARVRMGGYGTPGVGGVLGQTLDPSEWEIIPGTGAPLNAPRR